MVPSCVPEFSTIAKSRVKTLILGLYNAWKWPLSEVCFSHENPFCDSFSHFERLVLSVYRKCASLPPAVALIFFFSGLIWPDLGWSKGSCVFGPVDMFEMTPGCDVPPCRVCEEWWGDVCRLFWPVTH